ncbi:MAG: CshA/CshB family fibrillar adhesin-related protein [Porphyrobacter sp.]|jgi:uncharacterized repeat protein (TIGR01451 family)|nr:CshA/CshB family fibrillar adhesin-related protein [Porphyrobacter sp.]
MMRWRFRSFAKDLFTMFFYGKGMVAMGHILRRLLAVLLVLGALAWSPAASAQDCAPAATQGIAPASWQTYCWLNLANYNDTTARSASGQNMSFTLPDGSTLTFNARVTGTNPAYAAVTAASWGGSAMGNSGFIGIPGRTVLYSSQPGTSTIAITNITITPPAGGGVTVYSFVVADGESSNDGESIRMTSNGGAWQLLDSLLPGVGSTMPPLSGVGTGTVNITGTSGTVGAHILGSNSPTSVTVETRAGGLQGVMFAIRFATIRLQASILGPRLNAADQFSFQIASTANGAAMSSGTTSGTGAGPFSTAPLNMAAGISVTLRETMAAGSVSTLAQYSARLTCVNTAGPTRSALPNNVEATSFNIGQLQFGEALVCTFTNGAHPRVRLIKTMGTSRLFADDEFTIRIREGQTVIAQRTTEGSGSTITNGDTGFVQVVAGTGYILDEIAAGTANLGNYSATMTCTNTFTGSATTLPTAVGATITPRLGDTVTCTIRNSQRSTAVLVTTKTSTVISDPVNGTANPKLIPGAIVEYVITVRNVGTRRPDDASITIIDTMPADMAFATATPVSFTNGSPSSGLGTFNAATMVTYSSAPTGGAPYTYTPSGAFDANVRAIRIIPSGRMNAATSATSQPSFTIRFRARVQ